MQLLLQVFGECLEGTPDPSTVTSLELNCRYQPLANKHCGWVTTQLDLPGRSDQVTWPELVFDCRSGDETGTQQLNGTAGCGAPGHLASDQTLLCGASGCPRRPGWRRERYAVSARSPCQPDLGHRVRIGARDPSSVRGIGATRRNVVWTQARAASISVSFVFVRERPPATATLFRRRSGTVSTECEHVTGVLKIGRSVVHQPPELLRPG